MKKRSKEMAKCLNPDCPRDLNWSKYTVDSEPPSDTSRVFREAVSSPPYGMVLCTCGKYSIREPYRPPRRD